MPDWSEARTRSFDIGMWIFLALTTLYAYGSTLGLDITSLTNGAVALFAVFMLICLGCGFVSRTTTSVLYTVPLCLVLAPLFLVLAPGDVIVVMIAFAAIAGTFLPAGAWLRRLGDQSRHRPAND